MYMSNSAMMQALRCFIAEIDILLDTTYITVYQCSMIKTDIRNYIYDVYKDNTFSEDLKGKLKNLFEMTDKELPSPKKKSWFFKGLKNPDYEQTKAYKQQLYELRDEITSLVFFVEQTSGKARFRSNRVR